MCGMGKLGLSQEPADELWQAALSLPESSPSAAWHVGAASQAAAPTCSEERAAPLAAHCCSAAASSASRLALSTDISSRRGTRSTHVPTGSRRVACQHGAQDPAVSRQQAPR